MVGDDEYDELWAELTEDRGYYNDYAAETARKIPLVRLPKP